MNIGIWKKKPSKKELIDIIKIQEEEISRLNKEKMNFNVVIRNEKPIRIDTQGLDYMVDLEQKYYVLQDIIKKVRECIDNITLEKLDDFEKYKMIPLKDTWIGHSILEILDKER